MDDEKVLSKEDQSSEDTGQTEPTGADKTGTESESKPDKKAAPNWQDDPEYRRIQKERDKELGRLEKEAKRTKQENETLRKRMEALEDAAFGKDDYTKLQLALRRSEDARNSIAAQLNELRSEMQDERDKSKALQEIAEEFEVPVSTLKEATDYKDAVRLARIAWRELESKRREDDEEQAEANRPDVGGGAPSTSASRWEREYQEAMEKKDSVAQVRLLRQRKK